MMLQRLLQRIDPDLLLNLYVVVQLSPRDLVVRFEGLERCYQMDLRASSTASYFGSFGCSAIMPSLSRDCFCPLRAWLILASSRPARARPSSGSS
jgi:hypothetical protein